MIVGQKARALLAVGNFIGFERFDFVRASFDRIALGIAVRVRMRGFDDAEMIEEKRDAAGLAHANRP